MAAAASAVLLRLAGKRLPGAGARGSTPSPSLCSPSS